MKILCALLLSFILLASVSLCNASGNNKSIEYDFGTITPTRTVTHDFILTQAITNIAVLCECVKANVDTQKDALGALQTIVHVEFDPRDYKGTTVEEILLENSAGERITLRIKAFVQ